MSRFATVPSAEIPRSRFDLSHGLKTTFDADNLVPILIQDIIPGDTWNLSANFFARLATPIHPIMDNLYIDTFYFFVPNRLLWVNWEKFCGSQVDPADTIDYTIPTYTSVYTVTTGSTYDYMGLPVGKSSAVVGITALPARAVNLIWNEWFRDENLQDSKVVDTDNGPDDPADYYTLPVRGKRHDYFTSCLPWPQKGTAVDLPIGTTAPIATAGTDAQAFTILKDSGTNPEYLDSSGATLLIGAADPSSTNPLYADLSSATASTINDIRLAFQTQKLLERDARSGTRYTETLLAHWGVSNGDARLQRPEFLGGGSSAMNMTPVPQTTYQGTPTTTDAKGNLSAFATVSGGSGFTKSFTEHGILVGLANLRGDITYSQGIERYWSKSTRYDFFYPVLQGIGEQSVLNKEIWYTTAGHANNDLVFGYQERYAEYRTIPNRLSGLFRPDATSSLSPWIVSEDFSSLPTLGDTFIQANTSTPLDSAIAVSTEPHIIADFWFNINAARPMGQYGVPGNLDRF